MLVDYSSPSERSSNACFMHTFSGSSTSSLLNIYDHMEEQTKEDDNWTILVAKKDKQQRVT